MLEISFLSKRVNGVTAVQESVSPSVRAKSSLPRSKRRREEHDLMVIFALLAPWARSSSGRSGSRTRPNPTPDRLRPEGPNLYHFLSGREYLQLCGRLQGLPRRVLDSKMDEFLHLFSLWEDRHCPLSSYSKGMRQKILISAALLHNPEVLILDEPLSGLDVSTALVLRELLKVWRPREESSSTAPTCWRSWRRFVRAC